MGNCQLDKYSRTPVMGTNTAKCDQIRTKILPHAISRRSTPAMYSHRQPQTNCKMDEKWKSSRLRVERSSAKRLPHAIQPKYVSNFNYTAFDMLISYAVCV